MKNIGTEFDREIYDDNYFITNKEISNFYYDILNNLKKYNYDTDLNTFISKTYKDIDFLDFNNLNEMVDSYYDYFKESKIDFDEIIDFSVEYPNFTKDLYSIMDLIDDAQTNYKIKQRITSYLKDVYFYNIDENKYTFSPIDIIDYKTVNDLLKVLKLDLSMYKYIKLMLFLNENGYNEKFLDLFFEVTSSNDFKNSSSLKLQEFLDEYKINIDTLKFIYTLMYKDKNILMDFINVYLFTRKLSIDLIPSYKIDYKTMSNFDSYFQYKDYVNGRSSEEVVYSELDNIIEVNKSILSNDFFFKSKLNNFNDTVKFSLVNLEYLFQSDEMIERVKSIKTSNIMIFQIASITSIEIDEVKFSKVKVNEDQEDVSEDELSGTVEYVKVDFKRQDKDSETIIVKTSSDLSLVGGLMGENLDKISSISSFSENMSVHSDFNNSDLFSKLKDLLSGFMSGTSTYADIDFSEYLDMLSGFCANENPNDIDISLNTISSMNDGMNDVIGVLGGLESDGLTFPSTGNIKDNISEFLSSFKGDLMGQLSSEITNAYKETSALIAGLLSSNFNISSETYDKILDGLNGVFDDNSDCSDDGYMDNTFNDITDDVHTYISDNDKEEKQEFDTKPSLTFENISTLKLPGVYNVC